MRYNNINSINKEAPITYKIRINQPLFMFIIMFIVFALVPTINVELFDDITFVNNKPDVNELWAKKINKIILKLEKNK